jgi:hypothetical protein
MADDTITPETRFWAKVQQGAADECWPWLAAHSDSGQGNVRWRGRVTGAHRVSYLLCNGEIPPSLVVRHTCDRANCVNPAHLVLGTIQENNADRLARGRYGKWTRLDAPPKSLRKWRGGKAARPVAERFSESWEANESGCWIWKLAKLHFGHGAMTVGGKVKKAHRVSYELHCGPIPQGKMVLHRCDTPSCVNPAHLRLGTHAENMAEMSERGRAARGADNHFGRVAYHGPAHGMAKLTEDGVREIRSASKRGEITRVAQKYGITRAAAGHVRARRSWKHIP